MRNVIIIFAVIILFGCGQVDKYSVETTDIKPRLIYYLSHYTVAEFLSTQMDTIATNYFRDSCTKDELLDVLNCEMPKYRIEAFCALVNINEPDYFTILLNHLDDTTKLVWWPCDDVEEESFISDLMILKASNKLAQKQKDSLVYEVLNKHIYLESAQWMMKEIKPQDKYYSIIKTQCQIKSEDCHHLSLTYALAKFKRQEDIPIIKNNFAKYTDNSYCNTYIFQSIIAFPDTAFFSLLSKYFETEIKKKKQFTSDDLKYYCLAVAMFKNTSSLEILTALTKKETYPDTWYLPDNKKYVFTAMHKYQSPIYDNLYKELKPQMSNYVMEYLDKPDYDDRTTW